MQSRVDAATVANLARAQLGLDGAPLRVEPISSGKFSQTFLLVHRQGEYVVRVAPPDDMLLLFYERRMMRQEPALHRLIQKRTDVPIPTIVRYDFTRRRIDRDYLIMRRLPGRPLSEVASHLAPRQIDAILRELGRHVARLHAIRTKRYGYLGRHRPMEPQRRWDDAFAIMWEKLLDDCVGCGIYRPEDKTAAMRLWETYGWAFDPYVPASLCHMDLWSANILVHEGRFSALFDFDRACFGDRENDLAVAEYCGLTREPFWEGYGERPPRSPEWAVRRWFYLLYEHQKYIVISMSARRNDPARARDYARQCLESIAAFRRTGRPVF